MALDTDLSRSPYFDDYTPNSNHYAVLYRPGVPVQAREMNELQSILQDQIDKFGRSIYKEGSVIEGCSFSFDNKYSYVKIKDSYANGSAFTISDFVGRNIQNENGLKGIIVNAIPGFEAQNPDLNTLYIKYLNSSLYANNNIQKTFDKNENLVITTTAGVAVGNVTVANINYHVGRGYAMSVTDGVIFKKGYFIRVPAQTVVVTKYSNVPNYYSVGFAADESIETPASNTQLYDNAQGTPNYGAPGAHRLKLIPNLVVRDTYSLSNTDTFFSICDFQNGKPVTIKNDPQYSALGAQLARRTFETNGDFVVNPFLLTTEPKKLSVSISNTSTNTTHLNLVSSPGLGYVKGYRVEFLNRNTVSLRKGITTEAFENKTSANFGYYIYAREFVGDFNTDSIAQVELHNYEYTPIRNGTFLNTPYLSQKIGTAYIRGIEYFSGTPGSADANYIVYLFDINMDVGYNFNQVKSILYYPSSTLKAIADVVLTYDATTTTNIAKLEEITASTMVFPFGQKAVVANSFSNTSFIYRNRANSTFDTAGNMSITLAAASGTGSESFTYGAGYLSQVEKETFILIPTANGYSTNNAGTVTTSNLTSQVFGSGTSFTTDYRVGDVLFVSNSTVSNSTHSRVITSITNSTLLTVYSAFPNTAVFSGASHQLKFPAGQPISMLGRGGRTIDILSATAANISLGITPNSSFSVSVYHDILRETTVPIKKVINRNTIVKIDTSNNVAGTSGPWSLGVTDAFRLNSVWVSTNGSYSNTVPDTASSFILDNGQRDAYYDLAYLTPKTSNVPVGSKILVSIDHFTHDQTEGRGFFTANSYPVDDVNGSANTDAIVTAEIPLFTSPSKGTTFDLRDCVDFRPFVANTTVITSNTTAATINPPVTTTFTGATDSSIPGALGSYTISPNQLFETKLAHYLPRRDRVSINTAGQIVITEGVSSVNPRSPVELPGTMSLGIIDVPAYPTLSAYEAKLYNRYDYAPVINLSQIKRYTMADINTLSNRITNLEYYTSLSTLEQSATNLLIRSGTTGQNRFKNGILVDPFRGHDIGNTLHPQYLIAIDPNRQEARPFFKIWSQDLYVDHNFSSRYNVAGPKITIDFTEQIFQQQPYASKYHNCIEGNVYNWRGSIFLFPSGDLEPDRTTSPDVVNNLDLGSNWINLKADQAFGTVWGNWVTVSSSTATGAASTSSTSVTNPDGSTSTTYQTQTNVTTTLQQTRTGTATTTNVSNNTINLGTAVTNVSVQPYVRSKSVFFYARGLKPNAVVYPYFASTRVSEFCIQMYRYSEAVTMDGNIARSNSGEALYSLNTVGLFSSGTTYFSTYGKNWGAPLQVEPDGTLRGVFLIPASTFKIGDIEFRLTDIPSLAQGESAISTDASTTYMTNGLTVSYGQSILNTRQTTITQTEVIDNQTIQQNSVVYGQPVVIRVPPPPPVPQPSVPPATVVPWPPATIPPVNPATQSPYQPTLTPSEDITIINTQPDFPTVAPSNPGTQGPGPSPTDSPGHIDTPEPSYPDPSPSIAVIDPGTFEPAPSDTPRLTDTVVTVLPAVIVDTTVVDYGYWWGDGGDGGASGNGGAGSGAGSAGDAGDGGSGDGGGGAGE